MKNRKLTQSEAKKMDLMDKILSNSKLTEKDALEFGRKVNDSVAKRHNLK